MNGRLLTLLALVATPALLVSGTNTSTRAAGPRATAREVGLEQKNADSPWWLPRHTWYPSHGIARTAFGGSWDDEGIGLCVLPVLQAGPEETNYIGGRGEDPLPHNVDIGLRGQRLLQIAGSPYSVDVSYVAHAGTYTDGNAVGFSHIKMAAKVYRDGRLSHKKVRLRGYVVMDGLGPSVGAPAMAIFGDFTVLQRTPYLIYPSNTSCPNITPTGNVLGLRFTIQDVQIGTKHWPDAGFTATKTAVDDEYPSQPIRSAGQHASAGTGDEIHSPAHRDLNSGLPMHGMASTGPSAVPLDSDHPRTHWWQPIHAWMESNPSLRTERGIGPDEHGRVREFGCVRPFLPSDNGPSTNFTTLWADSLTQGWQPREMGPPVDVVLQGSRVFKIPDNVSQFLGLKKPYSQWTARVSFQVAASLSNQPRDGGQGPQLSMTLSWSGRVLKKGKPVPPGKCSDDGSCSRPTLSMDGSAVLEAYGPGVTAPAISGYVRTSGVDVSRYVVGDCPNFTANGHVAALMLLVPNIYVLNQSGDQYLFVDGSFDHQRFFATKFVHIG